MATAVVLLVIASAMAHAAWNAILKRCHDPENASVAIMSIAGMVSVTVALIARVPAPGPAATAWSLVSGLLEAGYFVTLARALSRAPLGSVYTVVRGGALIVVWPVSIVLLGEHVTIGSGAGTLLVVLGLAATGASARSASSSPKLRSGLAVAALCAMFVGGYHLAYKLALSSGGRPEAVVAISLSCAALISVSTLGARRRLVVAALRTQPVRIAIAGLLASAGFLVFLSAMKNADAGAVLTLRNTSILFAQILAFALGEPPKRLGVIGAGLVTLGAVLLTRG